MSEPITPAEPLPCPVCGIHPLLKRTNDSWFIVCVNADCGIRTQKWNSMDKALTAWNWRMESDSHATALAAVREDSAKALAHIDLMRDEFQRIAACPDVSSEILGLCARAIKNTHQHYPVIEQRDKALEQSKAWHIEVERLRDELATARRELAACRFTPLLNLHPGVTIRANELIAACRAVGIRILGDAVADDGMESDARLTAARAEAARLREALHKYGQHGRPCTFASWDTFGQGICDCGLQQALAPRETREGGK